MTSRFHRIAAKPRCTSRREDRFRYQVWPVASALLSPTLTGAQNPRLSQMRLPIDGTIHPHRSSKEARRSRPPGAWPIKLPLRLPPPGRPDLVERQPELLAHHLTAAGDIERTVTKPPCAAAEEPMVRRLSPGESWIRTFGSATEKLPLGAPCGFRERLHQLEEVLIPRGTKSSNPASSRRESRELLVREFLPSRSGGVVQRTIVGQAPCSCARASGPHRVLRARQTERTAGLPLGWRWVNPSAELMVDPGQVRGARSGTRVPL